MTDITLEQRALLPCPFCGGEAKRDDRTEYQSYSASESQSMGMGVSAGGFSSTTYAIQCGCGIRVQGNNDAFLIERWNRRSEAALRLSAGADSARLDALEALVDSQPDKALLLHHGQHGINGRYAGLGLSNTRRTLREAIDQAAPRHEPGEVQP